MPGKIIILPETLTHRIAAGEVVERPASIVKELIENALDAGATDISVELEKGGCQAIQVIDNGEGIAPDDIELAFTRHATSKIEVFEDLYRVRSFGFRGEALPSIASVARVEMVSRRAGSTAGVRLVVEGGGIRERVEAGCPVGTTVRVTRIFEPVPVRRKFLKSDMTEQGYCLDWITRLALARTEIRLRVSAGGRTLLNVPAAKDLAERIALTLGRDIRDPLVPVAGRRDQASIEGFASRPEFTRSSAAQIYVYVNGRYVRDYLLNHAVMTAYRRIIEPRRYPAAVLFLNVAEGDVDVNVHPTKMEVRFRDPRGIYGLIVESLAAASGTVRTAEGAGAGPSGPRSDYAARVEEALKRYRIASGPAKLIFEKRDTPRHAEPPPPERFEPPAEEPRAAAGEYRLQEEERRFSGFVYIGQVGGTYLVFEAEGGMVLVDQHAAHERILFEKLKRGPAGELGRPAGQRLLMPEVISLPPRDLAFVKQSLPILEEAGVELEPFGGDAVVVRSIPAFLSGTEARTLVADLIEESMEGDPGMPLTERRERIFTALACRGAVKANRRLSVPEVESLCRDLDALSCNATCPHGRPLTVAISKGELEKLFKRR